MWNAYEIAAKIMVESNTALVPKNRVWFMEAIADAIKERDKEIERLRAALEEIANYPPGDEIFAYRKLREKARDALIREFGGME